MASLTKLVALVSCPAYWPALLQGVAPTVEHREALKDFDFKTVIDVGANKGQFAFFAATQWPQADLHCFEPQPGPRATIDRLLGARATLHACALGAAEGIADLHLASRADSSSLLPLGHAQKKFFNMEEVGTLRVPVRRLDKVIATPRRPALLKIDVQGFEYEVLEGAKDLLSQIDAVYAEASFIELYEGQRIANDVETLLRGDGYRLEGCYNQTFDAGGSAVQVDMLFMQR